MYLSIKTVFVKISQTPVIFFYIFFNHLDTLLVGNYRGKMRVFIILTLVVAAYSNEILPSNYSYDYSEMLILMPWNYDKQYSFITSNFLLIQLCPWLKFSKLDHLGKFLLLISHFPMELKTLWFWKDSIPPKNLEWQEHLPAILLVILKMRNLLAFLLVAARVLMICTLLSILKIVDQATCTSWKIMLKLNWLKAYSR